MVFFNYFSCFMSEYITTTIVALFLKKFLCPIKLDSADRRLARSLSALDYKVGYISLNNR